jgi:hypothetical protein
MQIGSAGSAAHAFEQISRSVEMMNDLNQLIVDSSQTTDKKMLGFVVSSKVQESLEQGRLSLLA